MVRVSRLVTKGEDGKRIMPSSKAVTKELVRFRIHDSGLGMIVVVLAYVELGIGVWYSALRRLALLTCGIWTEDLLDELEVMHMAHRISDGNPSKSLGGAWLEDEQKVKQWEPALLKSNLEQACQLTAKLHGMFWLTIPGFAFLFKISDYLNQHPAWFCAGKRFSEIKGSGDFPQVEYEYFKTVAKVPRRATTREPGRARRRMLTRTCARCSPPDGGRGRRED